MLKIELFIITITVLFAQEEKTETQDGVIANPDTQDKNIQDAGNEKIPTDSENKSETENKNSQDAGNKENTENENLQTNNDNILENGNKDIASVENKKNTDNDNILENGNKDIPSVENQKNTQNENMEENKANPSMKSEAKTLNNQKPFQNKKTTADKDLALDSQPNQATQTVPASTEKPKDSPINKIKKTAELINQKKTSTSSQPPQENIKKASKNTGLNTPTDKNIEGDKPEASKPGIVPSKIYDTTPKKSIKQNKTKSQPVTPKADENRKSAQNKDSGDHLGDKKLQKGDKKLQKDDKKNKNSTVNEKNSQLPQAPQNLPTSTDSQIKNKNGESDQTLEIKNFLKSTRLSSKKLMSDPKITKKEKRKLKKIDKCIQDLEKKKRKRSKRKKKQKSNK